MGRPLGLSPPHLRVWRHGVLPDLFPANLLADANLLGRDVGLLRSMPGVVDISENKPGASSVWQQQGDRQQCCHR